jgi:hypothetical protein
VFKDNKFSNLIVYPQSCDSQLWATKNKPDLKSLILQISNHFYWLFIFKKKLTAVKTNGEEKTKRKDRDYEFFLPLSLGSTASHPQVLHMCRKLNDEKGWIPSWIHPHTTLTWVFSHSHEDRVFTIKLDAVYLSKKGKMGDEKYLQKRQVKKSWKWDCAQWVKPSW